MDPDGNHAPAVKILGSLVGALVGAHVGVSRLDVGYGPVVPSLVALAHRLADLES